MVERHENEARKSDVEKVLFGNPLLAYNCVQFYSIVTLFPDLRFHTAVVGSWAGVKVETEANCRMIKCGLGTRLLQ